MTPRGGPRSRQASRSVAREVSHPSKARPPPPPPSRRHHVRIASSSPGRRGSRAARPGTRSPPRGRARGAYGGAGRGGWRTPRRFGCEGRRRTAPGESTAGVGTEGDPKRVGSTRAGGGIGRGGVCGAPVAVEGEYPHDEREGFEPGVARDAAPRAPDIASWRDDEKVVVSAAERTNGAMVTGSGSRPIRAHPSRARAFVRSNRRDAIHGRARDRGGGSGARARVAVAGADAARASDPASPSVRGSVRRVRCRRVRPARRHALPAGEAPRETRLRRAPGGRRGRAQGDRGGRGERVRYPRPLASLRRQIHRARGRRCAPRHPRRPRLDADAAPGISFRTTTRPASSRQSFYARGASRRRTA